ncbi:MAG: co-chaperone GroES [Candidatus Magasanikbacteria bacterium CG10_big_fil_rev_8_21_14_0_10_43_6]|uniref:Co-chaperonin GroES n=1 Tax=Candidatus Magasanikbacteria bacterium CG10_big_fil_rev_8_21_14_0_10_43_6 TaxID=1974650 RepID=A0A2M6W0L3_9BACT|nr:MAG: co-chaperone GroES [Candidatus Magasanikbacteria bacterium CG10_big_fil_rev_8_21_14_0_10_43_6]
MQVKPLGNRVLVQLMKEEEVTKSGIVLPDSVDKEKKTEGTVVAVGTGKINDNGTPIAIPVSVGQKVLVKTWGGDEVTMDGEEYKIFDADDLLAVIE